MNIGKSSGKARIIYVIIYFFGLIGGIIGYFLGHGRTKTHAKQAIILGILEILTGLFLVVGTTLTVSTAMPLTGFSISSISSLIGLIGILLGIFDITFLRK
jgi:hypothetical protein